ncbi:MAG: dTMP kinase, partial [Candidatus Poseidoniia archaeon]|jgi:dTMP kinase|nr:dTMP kinase [Candidatus Poseidoniia archaeon]MDP7255731.1 dTMP kinase [Candidatus Poseidoniia archaeon]MDP7589412.1 dTMP kinase [Candidatus Poseidoniia archaeon]|tara:strand:- start:19899 stop:20513 length:615 start_codon:yes stop_codon:yes gene_type:complete
MAHKQLRARRCVLIDLEGIDGCGKSTQAQLLAQRLRDTDHTVVVLKEPTDGPHGSQLKAVLRGERNANAEEVLTLFADDRREHVAARIIPALERGEIVLMDRYYYSTLAYQCAAGIPAERIRAVNAFAPTPTIVLVFDLPVGQALERVHSHSVADTFERAPHLERVRAAYLALRDDPLVRILDATQPPVAVAADVWALVSEAMA